MNRFSISTLVLVIGVLVLSLCPAARAESDGGKVRQFANLIYKIPPDFTKGRSDEGHVVLHSDSDKLDVFASIRIYCGVDKKDVGKLSLKEWAESKMSADLDKDDEVTIKPQVNPTKIGSTNALMIARAVKNRGTTMQFYLAMDLPTRYELLRFDGPADDLEEINTSKKLLNEHFLPMVNSIRAVSKGAKPLLGEPTAGPYSGIWFGGGLQMSVGMDMLARTDFVTSTFTFFKDGRFYEGVPEGGVRAFDYNSEVIRNANAVGNYAVQGKTLKLFYADGETDELEIEDEILRHDVKTLTLCKTPPDNFRFAGTRRFLYASGIAPGVMGGVSSYNSTTFTKDGKFQHDAGAGANATYDNGSGFATSSSSEVKGTYVVKDGFIILTDDQGKEFNRWTILLSEGEEDGKPTTQIVVDGDYVN